jgi:hypothetical protein
MRGSVSQASTLSAGQRIGLITAVALAILLTGGLGALMFLAEPVRAIVKEAISGRKTCAVNTTSSAPPVQPLIGQVNTAATKVLGAVQTGKFSLEDVKIEGVLNDCLVTQILEDLNQNILQGTTPRPLLLYRVTGRFQVDIVVHELKQICNSQGKSPALVVCNSLNSTQVGLHANTYKDISKEMGYDVPIGEINFWLNSLKTPLNNKFLEAIQQMKS